MFAREICCAKLTSWNGTMRSASAVDCRGGKRIICRLSSRKHWHNESCFVRIEISAHFIIAKYTPMSAQSQTHGL